MKVLDISNDDAQNYLFCRLQLEVETLVNLMKQPIKIQQKSLKLLSQQSFKTLGTSVLNRPMSPPSMDLNHTFIIKIIT